MSVNRETHEVCELGRRFARLARENSQLVDGGGRSERLARDCLDLELACDEVETKLLKREQYGAASREAEAELSSARARLDGALWRLSSTLERTREKSRTPRTPGTRSNP